MRTTQGQRGVALILTLVAIAIVGVLAAGIGTLVVGHFTRARTDQDAAKALNLAESALNFQAQKINARLGGTQVLYDPAMANFGTASYGSPANPYPVHDVSVTTHVSNTTKSLATDYMKINTGAGDVSLAWVDPTPLNLYNNDPSDTQYIYGQATVNGVTRTVRAKGGSKGVFDDFAVFGLNGVGFAGNNQIVINGYAGSNTALTSTSGSVTMTGAILAGGATNGTAPNYNNGIDSPTPESIPAPFPYPPITELAFDVATGVSQWAPAQAGGAVPAYQEAIAVKLLDNPTAGIKLFNNATTATNDNNAGVLTNSSGQTLAFPVNGAVSNQQTLTLHGKPWGANYYMTGLNAAGPVVANLSQGPINLWIDSNSNNGDSISGNFSVTGNNVNQFRIYYRNPNNNGGLTLTGGGNSGLNIKAMVYVYDINPYPNGTKFGTIRISGNVNIEGSIIGYNINPINRSVTITHPSNPGAQPGEGILFYGLQTPWQEFNPPRGF